MSLGYDWAHAARCREIGVEPFFPGDGPSNNYDAPRRICNTCPVRLLCLEAALQREGNAHKEYRGGMWGGLTPREREHLALNRKKQAAA